MELQLRFQDGILYAASHVSDDVNYLDTIVAVLLAVWKFRKYTDSRWLSLGRAAQRLAAAELTGLTCMLSFALSQPSVSGFFLNQFWRSQEDNCWTFIVEAALVAQVPDAVLAEVMRDNRVGRTAPILERLLSERMIWITTVSTFVWKKWQAWLI